MKTSLEKRICVLSNLITSIWTLSICQMQATFPGVEFLRILFKFKKRKQNSWWHVHRRTGNFLPGGAVNYNAQKILASCPNVYETVEKKRGQTMQQRRPYWHMKVARYCNSFTGSIPPNFEHNYVAVDKHLEKLLP